MSINISKLLDKEWEGKCLEEVLDASVSALQGVTEKTAEVLTKTMHIKTVRDLATNKFVKMAQALLLMSELNIE